MCSVSNLLTIQNPRKLSIKKKFKKLKVVTLHFEKFRGDKLNTQFQR